MVALEVALETRDKNTILDLLMALKEGFEARTDGEEKSRSAGQSRDCKEPAAGEAEGNNVDRRAQRAREAIAEDRAKEKRDKVKAEMLKEELKKEMKSAAARKDQVGKSTEAAGAASKRGPNVRLTICAEKNPAEKKPVVLPRADNLTELLAIAKKKLRMKKVGGAKLMETGAVVRGTADLDDGCVVVVCAEAIGDEPPAASTEHSQQQHSERGAARASETKEGAAETKGHAAAACSNHGDKAELSRAARAPRTALPRRVSGSAAEAEQAQLAACTTPRAMASARAALPMAAKRQECIEAIEAHPVVVLQGEPGCGKSTQYAHALKHAPCPHVS
eukprot:357772-Pleurochrysis_carterae.AAC.1